MTDYTPEELNSGEIWQPVVGYEGLYEVSNMGRIKSFWNHHGQGEVVRKPSADPRVYPQMCMTNSKGKQATKRVHRMVAEAFLGPCPEGKQCGHLDGDRTNNRTDNLRWVTQKENDSHKKRHRTLIFGEDHYSTKLSNAKVKAMRLDFKNGLLRPDIIKKYGVSQKTVWEITSGKGWSLVK